MNNVSEVTDAVFSDQLIACVLLVVISIKANYWGGRSQN